MLMMMMAAKALRTISRPGTDESWRRQLPGLLYFGPPLRYRLLGEVFKIASVWGLRAGL